MSSMASAPLQRRKRPQRPNGARIVNRPIKKQYKRLRLSMLNEIADKTDVEIGRILQKHFLNKSLYGYMLPPAGEERRALLLRVIRASSLKGALVAFSVYCARINELAFAGLAFKSAFAPQIRSQIRERQAASRGRSTAGKNFQARLRKAKEKARAIHDRELLRRIPPSPNKIFVARVSDATGLSAGHVKNQLGEWGLTKAERVRAWRDQVKHRSPVSAKKKPKRTQ